MPRTETEEVLQMGAFEEARWRASRALRCILESDAAPAESKDAAQAAFDSIMDTMKTHRRRLRSHCGVDAKSRRDDMRARRRFKELRRSMDDSTPPSSYEEEARAAAAERAAAAAQKAADMRLVSRESLRDLEQVVAAADRLAAQAAALGAARR